MSVLNSSIVPASATGGYEIDNSLRFNDNDSAYLSRTLTSTGNQKTWTWSGWVKRGSNIGSGYHGIMGATGSGVDSGMRFEGSYNDRIRFYDWNNGYTTNQYTVAKFRDPSAWYHLVWIYDTTNSTQSDRSILYVNGIRQDVVVDNATTSNGYSGFNYSGNTHKIGQYGPNTNSTYAFDGYQAEVNFIDGQALDPSNFGETGDYGEWKPIEYTGTYGTNGFYLDFSNTGDKHTITANGGISHSTAQSKIGGSSITLDGSNDYLNISDHKDFDFGSNDFTIEAWVRYSVIATDYDQSIFSKRTYGSYGMMNFWINEDTGTLQMIGDSNDGTPWDINITSTSSLSTDTWNHIALQRSGSEISFWINGVKDSTTGTFSGSFYNETEDVKIGYGNDANQYLKGYMDEIRVSNTARYTSNFTPSTTAFTDDSNTLLLIHSDTTNGSTTFTDDSGVVGGLGNDQSSNTNNWTTNNLAATDQMLDTPTNNFATLNPLDNSGATLLEGNLDFYAPGGSGSLYTKGTFGASTGKWYFEVDIISTGNGPYWGLAAISDAGELTTAVNGIYFQFDGYVVSNGSNVGSGLGSFSAGDISGVAIDMTASTIQFYKNGSTIGTAYSLPTETADGFVPWFRGNAAQMRLNFGQDSSFAGNKTGSAGPYTDSNSVGDFYYEPPTGFNALCTQNLPDPDVIPSEHFNTVTYSGDDVTAASGGQAISDVGFQPDMTWIKSRNSTHYHSIHDAVRGVGTGTNETLYTNSTEAEPTAGEIHIKSFDADGVTVAKGDSGSTNGSGYNYVAWNWKANGSGSSNTDGTINTTSTSANVDAGFSIVTYTGAGGTATVGHGLSSAPEMVIAKTRNSGTYWPVYHESNGNTKIVKLDTTMATDTTSHWNNTTPSTTLVYLGNTWEANRSGYDQLLYCFHSVDGYSKVGSYTGNGSSDGTFVYTGFRPAYVMVKSTTVSGEGFVIFNNKSNPDNLVDYYLTAYGSTAEQGPMTTRSLDFTSNGFKWRGNSTEVNKNGETYIYIAFAEQPFKHTNAR